MTCLRKAKYEEAERILKFYQNTIKSIRKSEFKPKWNDNYPNHEFITACIEKEELYVCRKDDEIIACVVLNDKFNPEYENIDWTVNPKSPEEILVIHTFAVAPHCAGKGIGRKIFNQIKKNAIKNGKKAIRVDIINGNAGAKKVFEKFGFAYVDSVEIFHEAVGLEIFHLFENKL